MIQRIRGRRFPWALLILGLAVVFIGIGVARGEHRLVLSKAIRICLECIGIG